MNKVTPTRTIRVGAREANQQFSKLLREVEAGAEVIISRSGTEVARIQPTQEGMSKEQRRRKIDAMLKFMETHAGNSGGYKFVREDAYEEIDEHLDRY